MVELRIEHYKALKEEHRQYLFQVQQLWLFKLSTLGVVIATAIFNDKIINVGLEARTIGAAGLFSLPILSFIIDLKVLEVGLHVKLISQHIKEKYADIPEILDWETKLWSGTQFSALRTKLTITASIGTSLFVLIVSFLLIYSLYPQAFLVLSLTASVSIVITALISLKLIPKMLE